ncbi:hypothetical protein GCM10027614_59160 [Micromonospora vulcania]
MLRFIGGGVLVAVGIIGVAAVYSPAQNFDAVINGVIFALVGLAGVGVVAAPVLWRTYNQLRSEREGASASRSGPNWPPWCTTRCCTPWR